MCGRARLGLQLCVNAHVNSLHTYTHSAAVHARLPHIVLYFCTFTMSNFFLVAGSTLLDGDGRK